MSSPSYDSDPVYTPEEQRQRLARLQKEYSQINSREPNPFLDGLSRFGSTFTNGLNSYQGLPGSSLIGNLLIRGRNTDPLTGMSIPTPAQLQQFAKTNVQNRMNQAAANQSRDAGILQRQEKELLASQAIAQENAAAAELQRQIDQGNAFYNSMLGNTADTSGYDAALRNIGKERNKSKKRYQTYSAQISDLFGNLGRKSTAYAEEQANISQQSEITRSQMAAQQAQQAQRTREADATRLKAANEARVALGGSVAESDLATQESEMALTDQQALGQTTMDTILANEALAKLVSSRQAGGFDMAGQQAQTELNMSYEDLLSSLANAEAQTQMQRSQAISAGAPSPSDRLAVENARLNYFKGLASEGSVDSPEAAVTVWKKANPNSAQGADLLLGSFIPWITTSAPAENATGKEPSFLDLINAYTTAEGNEEGAAILQSDPALYNLLQTYLNIK